MRKYDPCISTMSALVCEGPRSRHGLLANLLPTSTNLHVIIFSSECFCISCACLYGVCSCVYTCLHVCRHNYVYECVHMHLWGPEVAVSGLLGSFSTLYIDIESLERLLKPLSSVTTHPYSRIIGRLPHILSSGALNILRFPCFLGVTPVWYQMFI